MERAGDVDPADSRDLLPNLTLNEASGAWIYFVVSDYARLGHPREPETTGAGL